MPKKKTTGSALLDPDDDAPDLTETFFREAEIRQGEIVVRRGRPPLLAPKQQVTLRFPAEILARLRARGPGWQALVVRVVEKELAESQDP